MVHFASSSYVAENSAAIYVVVVVVVVVEIFIHGAVKATVTNALQSQLIK